MVAFRLRAEALGALARLSQKTGKTRTRIVEEALMSHSSDGPPAPRQKEAAT